MHSSVYRLFVILFLLLALAAPIATAAPETPGQPPAIALPDGTGAVSGVVFLDADGNGVQGAGEPGISAVGLTLRNTATGSPGSAATAADGGYSFTGLNVGAYEVTQAIPTSYVSTTLNVVTVLVVSGPVGGVNFGDAYPVTVRGTVFSDLDGDTVLGLGEPGIPDALVQVYADLNANGLRDAGEPLLGSAPSDSQGNYVILGLAPGKRVVVITPPGGASGGPAEIPLPLISGEGGGQTRLVDLATAPDSAGTGSLLGMLWNDANGNEIIDEGEPPLTGVRLTLYKDSDGNGVIGTADLPAAVKQQTDAQGHYEWTGLSPVAYVLYVDVSTLPARWAASFDPSKQAFVLGGGQARRLDAGYYDPLAPMSMRVAEWKKELRRDGKPNYTAVQVAQLVADAEAGSKVFAEAEPLVQALLKPHGGPEGQARQENAALRLNMASSRLLAKTPIRLLELTTATTVGAAAMEIETLLWPPAAQEHKTYERVRKLAEAINGGKGVGYGLTGSAALTRALCNTSTDCTNAVKKNDGGTLDLDMAAPLRLMKWLPSVSDGEINVLNPRLNLTVDVFYNGGILEVTQVLPDGREISLGTVTPPVWNKDIKLTSAFSLWNVSTVESLRSVELRVYVRDRDDDAGLKEHVKINYAVLTFQY